MKAYNQRDYSNTLGTGSTTIAQEGCTITCVGMFAGIDPVEVNRRMIAVGGYVNGNLVNWTKLHDAMPWIDFVYRHYSYDNTIALQAIKDHGAVLIEVDFDGTPKTTDKHWVLYIGGGRMLDPWTGNEVSTTKYAIVTGMAVLRRTDGKRAGDAPDAGGDDGCLLPNNDTNRKIFENLVSNSSKADFTVQYLGLGSSANDVSQDTIKKSLAARDGELSAVKTRVAALSSEVDNRVEQVSRLEDELTKQSDAHKAELIALKSSVLDSEKVVSQYKSMYEQEHSKYLEEAKAKGRVQNELAECQQKLKDAQKNVLIGLSFFDKLKLVFFGGK